MRFSTQQRAGWESGRFEELRVVSLLSESMTIIVDRIDSKIDCRRRAGTLTTQLHHNFLDPNDTDNNLFEINLNSTWTVLNLRDGQSIRLYVNVDSFDESVERQAIMVLNFLAEDHSSVPTDGLYYRSNTGSPFLYLQIKSNGQHYVDLPVPSGARTLLFSIQKWQGKSPSVVFSNNFQYAHISDSSPRPNLTYTPDNAKEVHTQWCRQEKRNSDDAQGDLDKNVKWSTFAVEKSHSIQVEIDLESDASELKAAVCMVSFLDRNGREITTGIDLSLSSEIGYFFYVSAEPNIKRNIKELRIPQSAVTVKLGLRTWAVDNVRLQSPIRLNKTTKIAKSNDSKSKSSKLRDPRKIRVAFIADEFTYNSFSYECDAIALTPENWREQMIRHEPELLFCESAWSGADSEVRPWKGQIYGSVNFPKENRSTLFAILNYCKENAIPTVFWNKEDPTHFGDKVHDFVDTAKHFDQVFTTAEECVARYRNEYGIENIDVLPFATQPKLFNPSMNRHRSSGVTFAGGWYANHVERCRDTAAIFDAVIEAGMKLVIFDRFYGGTDPLHQYPEKYSKFTLPSIPHDEVANAYKSTDYGININTVNDSPTMFARRVFELASCNTFIISNPALGLQTFFEDEILIIEPDKSTKSNVQNLQDFHSDSTRQRALRKVLESHTYRHRFATVLNKIGIKHVETKRRISVFCPVDNFEEAELAITGARRLGNVVCSLTLLVSQRVENAHVADFYQRYNKYGVQVVSVAGMKQYGTHIDNFDQNTDFMITGAQDLGEINSDRIEGMLVHREYCDTILAWADKPENRYQYCSQTDSSIVLYPSASFDLVKALDSKVEGLIYNV